MDAVAVAGPTASGKSAVALQAAQRLRAEIVNADSRQIYRGLDIGSAKPSEEERRLVPHHLYDVADPDELFDCARYRRLALQAIAEVRGRGRLPLVVGGTGLYLRVLRGGLFEGPPRDPALRAELEAAERRSPGYLHRTVTRVDPGAARRLHPRDRVRLVRALEVYLCTGTPLSEWQRRHGFSTGLRMPLFVIGLDRSALYERIRRRCREMLRDGLIDEVKRLRARWSGSPAPALDSIGYREVGRYLDGACTLGEALAEMDRATRRLAKRQRTWFRRERDVQWLDGSLGPGDLAAIVAELLRAGAGA